MLSSPTNGRRLAGRALLLVSVAVALPLTATRAINYVDVPAPAATPMVPAVPASIAAPATPAPLAVVAPVAPVPAIAPVHPVSSIDFRGKRVIIDGHSKAFSELTPSERAELRKSIAEARRGLADARVDPEEIRAEIRAAMDEVRINRREMRRDLAEARADVEQAMREIDRNAVHIRRSGQDPEQIKATVRASLASVAAIDVDAISRQALSSIDERQIEASIAAAQQSVRAAEAELDRIEELNDDD